MADVEEHSPDVPVDQPDVNQPDANEPQVAALTYDLNALMVKDE